MTRPREMTHPRTIKLYYKVASSQLPAPQLAPRTKVALQSRQFSSSSSPDTPRTKVVLESRQFSSSSSPHTPRTQVALQSRQFSASSSPDTPRTKVVLQSRQFSSSSSPDAPRTQVALQSRQFSATRSPQRVARDKTKSHSRLHFARSTRTISAEGCPRQIQNHARLHFAHSTRTISAEGCGSNRTLACISLARRARFPQRVARDRDKSHSRLHFAHSTRTISAEGCPRQIPNALSPAFRALDAHDLRRGLRRTRSKRTLACISRTRHARSPQRVARAKTKSHSRDPRRGLPTTGTNRTLACISRTRHARSPQRFARAKSKTHSRLRFAHSTRTISAEGCAGPGQNALSPALRVFDTHDLRRGLPATKPNRTLACISRARHAAIPADGCPRPGQIALSPAFRALDTHDLRRGRPAPNPKRALACVSRIRHARSAQRVAPDRVKTHSRLHFAHSTRTISAEGCPRQNQIALSPAFRALDTHDPRRGLPAPNPKRTPACISRIRHARSAQRVAPDRVKTHSRLHFAHSTRTISAEGCPRQNQIALSPAFRALDTHDPRRGLPAPNPKRTPACISRTRHARSLQRVARAKSKTHSRLHFAEGCPRPGQIALSLAFRDTRDPRRGLPATGTNRPLACISRVRHARSPQRVAFRGGPAALPRALREKVKKSERKRCEM